MIRLEDIDELNILKEFEMTISYGASSEKQDRLHFSQDLMTVLRVTSGKEGHIYKFKEEQEYDKITKGNGEKGGLAR